MDQSPLLSPGQEDLWLHHQAHPESTAYNAALALLVASPVDTAVLRAAFSAVLARHEQLRSGFQQGPDGRPRRTVPPTYEAEFAVHDTDGSTAHTVRPRVQEFVDRPFRLEEPAGCVRAGFFRLSADEGVLVVVAHHIVTDFLSHGRIVEDLLTLYGALRTSAEPSLPPLSSSYADFVLEEIRDAAAPDTTRHADAAPEGPDPGTVGLPGLVPRRRRTGTGTTELDLPAELLPRLRAAARSANASLFPVLLTAYQEVLHRHAGEPSGGVTLVCPVTSARRRHFPGAVGYFVKPLLVRAANRTEQPLAHAVRNAQTLVESARVRPQPSLAQIAARLGGGAGAGPVEQFGFGYQRTTTRLPLLDLFASGESPRRLELAGLTLGAYDVRHQEGQFDIAVEVVETSTTSKLVVRHRLDVCGADGARTLAAHFAAMLRAVPDHLHTPLRSVPIPVPEEDALLRSWSTGAAAPAPGPQVHELIAERAGRDPSALAVRAAGAEWSYAELHRRAEQITKFLRGRGVRAGSRVGICLPRCPEQVSVMLGVLHAGAAFVPLDPAYPADRLSYMAQDADVHCVVARRDAVPEGAFRPEKLVFEEEWAHETGPVAAVPTAAGGDDAYVIYTSGSTGRPKGVAVGHVPLSHLALWQRRHFGLRPQDVVLRFAPASFDAFVWEVLLALTAGASLYVPDPEVVLAGSGLAEAIRAGTVTHVALPPSVLSGLDPSQVPSLADIVVAGEECAPALAARWVADGRRVSNVYGQTETTIGATLYRVEGDEQFLPLGPPNHNVRVEVVDGEQSAVPVGVPGEILVSGATVAGGYLNQPERTARSFLPATAQRERGYRTGDLGCWTAEGELRFLGRCDSQVKVRGFRIEPGEVEAVLATHSSVRDAAVVAVGEGGHRHLVAFVTGPRGQAVPDAAVLRGWLARRLPSHFVPSDIVAIDDMPRTPNGKIDRARLAAAAPAEGATPRSATWATDLEAAVASVWTSLLHRPVGPDDDFFALGGHSLLAVEAVGLLQETLGHEVPLRLVFTHPTAASLAAELHDARPAAT
ncbi:amino acid adenylation domain-containing protein [Streptomyces sp. NPDC001668]|uniref:non-ribosomal peptide synthetase n=1 Tax=unclassified Streptomyces TaxID=2593676 RepID=UPI0036CD8B6A